MFFISITKEEISQNFHNNNIETYKINSMILTILTDKKLSISSQESHIISVIESPILDLETNEHVIFSNNEYNKEKGTLTISRSTISGRPLYYHINNKGEFFCSTHISLLRDAGVLIKENAQVLPEFFIFRYVIPPNTLYKDIYQLFAGEALTIKQNNEKCTILKQTTYFPPQQKKQADHIQVVDETYQLLKDTMNALTPRKKNISTLFSGGLDSSILFKIAQMNHDANLTFSTGYPFELEQHNFEKQYAQSAADLLHSDHYYYDFKNEDYLHGLIDAISISEIPVHHLQSVMIHLLSKKIPSSNNLIVCGLGADDLFGTSQHDTLHSIQKNYLFRILTKYPLYTIIQNFSKILGKYETFSKSLEFYRRSSLPFSDKHNLLWSLGVYGSEEWATSYFDTTKEKVIEYRKKAIEPIKQRIIYDLISLLYFYSSTSTTQPIWSKLGESNNQIFYYPFCEKKLIDYAFSIPWDIRLKHHKYILSSVAHNIGIPEEIITRPKKSFGVRPELWAEKGGAFEPLLPLMTTIFHKNQIKSMQSANIYKAMTLWNMINYALWKRLSINNEPRESLHEELCI